MSRPRNSDRAELRGTATAGAAAHGETELARGEDYCAATRNRAATARSRGCDHAAAFKENIRRVVRNNVSASPTARLRGDGLSPPEPRAGEVGRNSRGQLRGTARTIHPRGRSAPCP